MGLKCEEKRAALSHYINGYCVFDEVYMQTFECIMIVVHVLCILVMLDFIRKAMIKCKVMTTYNPNILHV